ncbi:hypothetical protein ACJMK2_022365, partial [Sinanodonta woodiana]
RYRVEINNVTITYMDNELMPTFAGFHHYCQAFGADLSVINSQQEQQFVNGMLRPLHGNFQNTTHFLTYFNWAPGQPDDLNGQHCIGMFKDNSFMWDDQDCEVPNYSL